MLKKQNVTHPKAVKLATLSGSNVAWREALYAAHGTPEVRGHVSTRILFKTVQFGAFWSLKM